MWSKIHSVMKMSAQLFHQWSQQKDKCQEERGKWETKQGRWPCYCTSPWCFYSLSVVHRSGPHSPRKEAEELGEVWGGQRGWWGCRTGLLRLQVRCWEGCEAWYRSISSWMAWQKWGDCYCLFQSQDLGVPSLGSRWEVSGNNIKLF